MNVETIKHNGHIVISDIKNNQYFKQVYIGYSMAEAKRKFKQYIKRDVMIEKEYCAHDFEALRQRLFKKLEETGYLKKQN